MKIAKKDGLYRKPRLEAESKVPLLVWLPIVLGLSTLVLLLSLHTITLQNGPLPKIELARKNTWKVVALGDIACSPRDPDYNEGNGIARACGHKEVADAIEREFADAIYLLGDLQYDNGIFEDFEKSFIPHYRTIQTPMYAVPGNHDYGMGNLDGYKKAFRQYMPQVTYESKGRSYYEFRTGPWQVYALDSNCIFVGGCEQKSEQFVWLSERANADDPICSVALWHHPRYTSGIHKGPEETLLTKDFWEALDFAGVDIVLSGHDHHYERFQKMNATGLPDENGIRQFVSGAGGHSLRTPGQPYTGGSEKIISDQFGYLVLELSHGDYAWEFKNIYGDVLDSGSDICR